MPGHADFVHQRPAQRLDRLRSHGGTQPPKEPSRRWMPAVAAAAEEPGVRGWAWRLSAVSPAARWSPSVARHRSSAGCAGSCCWMQRRLASMPPTSDPRRRRAGLAQRQAAHVHRGFLGQAGCPPPRRAPPRGGDLAGVPSPTGNVHCRPWRAQDGLVGPEVGVFDQPVDCRARYQSVDREIVARQRRLCVVGNRSNGCPGPGPAAQASPDHAEARAAAIE